MAYKLPVQPALAVCMQLSTPDDIDDATKMFVRNINIAAESSTCCQRPNSPSDPAHALLKPEVLDLVRLKRTLLRRFMRTRVPAVKREYVVLRTILRNFCLEQ